MVKKRQKHQSPVQCRVSPYPEVNLFIGILREAWVDALLPSLEHKEELNWFEFQRERERKDAVKFMEGTEKAWNESFEIICGLLNIEATEFRKGYFVFKKHYATDHRFKPEDAFNTFIWSLFDD